MSEVTVSQILREEPFNLNDNEIKDFLNVASKLGLTLDDFLEGNVYKKESIKSPGSYTEVEKQCIHEDIKTVFRNTFNYARVEKKKRYIATSGAPGVGKSTFLEDNLYRFATPYVDPDRHGLKLMYSSYRAQEKADNQEAYLQFRDASNFIANMMFVYSVYKGYSIVHGTTSTSGRVKSLYPALKEYGYDIEIHVLFAPTQSRELALEHRIEVQDFYQNTVTDAKGKFAPVFDRMHDAYLNFADKIECYYNNGKYWLGEGSLAHFASFDRNSRNKGLTLKSNAAQMISQIQRDIVDDIEDSVNQKKALDLFRDSIQYTYRDYLPSFSTKNVLKFAAIAGFTGVAISYASSRNRPKI